jgi:hypothetical protein
MNIALFQNARGVGRPFGPKYSAEPRGDLWLQWMATLWANMEAYRLALLERGQPNRTNVRPLAAMLGMPPRGQLGRAASRDMRVTSDWQPGGAGFESRLGHRLFSLRLLEVVLSPSGKFRDTASIWARQLPCKSSPVHQSSCHRTVLTASSRLGACTCSTLPVHNESKPSEGVH